MHDLLQPLVGAGPRTTVIFYGVAGTLGLLALIILWQILGPGPRRRRGLKRVKRRLAAGAWQEALTRVRKLRSRGRPSPAWMKRFYEAEAECLRTAAQLALADKRFEDALGFLLQVAHVLGEPEIGAKMAVQSAMLEEVRRLFSVTTLGDNKPVQDLIARVLLVEAPCREASFWQALCYLRGGEPDRAIVALQMERGEIDPPLYLGALLLRAGRAKEALKYLTEAKRIDANCPVVTLQLGAAMIASGGDTQLAVRALQRALGLKGLALWEREPRKAWIEGFPEGRSFIRKLASDYPFVCPIWGGDLNILLHQGNRALAQGHYKLGAYPEAADLFGKVLQNSAPSLVVLRGLGLALARQGKYDEAFKHLRSAYEMEEPKDRITAGYLALCGAMGKPTQPEDKTRNILWALKIVTHFNAPGDREWVALISTLFAEARENCEPKGSSDDEPKGVSPRVPALTLDDQLYLCEHLWSIQDASPLAAQAFHHLQATFPQVVRNEYAWLYCRAAQEHKAAGIHALALFARTFADPEPARAFFAEKQWDFAEMEFAYLELAAAMDPGHFPEALGPEYPARAEELLLSRSRRQELANQPDAALASAEILHELAPGSPQALDRLACLHHRSGHPEQAVSILESWHKHYPLDPRPLVRIALLHHQRGLEGECQIMLREALNLSEGTRKARIAFLGARLTLQNAPASARPDSNGAISFESGALAQAEEFLQQCLRADPGHVDALWCLAAVRWLRGDLIGLAEQAAVMKHRKVQEVRFQFFASLSFLAAHDFGGVLEIRALLAANRPQELSNPVPVNGAPKRTGVNWEVEIDYLAGLAYLGLEQNAPAAQDLQKPALHRDSPSASHAQALLGSISFFAHNHEEACIWWQSLDPKKRTAWQLGATLANTVFLTALEAATRGDFEKAAEKLRAAGKLGCRDRRLGALLVMALFKAGQAVVYKPLD